MQLNWIKLWLEIISDPKILKLDYETRWFVIDCLCLAGRMNDGGKLGTIEEITLMLPKGETGEKRKLAALSKAGIVTEKKGIWYLTNFLKRQGKPSDNPERVAERVKRHRGKKSSGGIETPLNRPPLGVSEAFQEGCNAPESPQKRREEKRRELNQEPTTTTKPAASPVDNFPDSPPRAEITEKDRPELDFLTRTLAEACGLQVRDRACWTAAEVIWDNFPEVTPSMIAEQFGLRGSFRKTLPRGTVITPKLILDSLQTILDETPHPAVAPVPEAS